MSDPVAAVRGLFADIERVAAAFEATSGRTETRVREVVGELEGIREVADGARTRAERAEKATRILREEREVIRDALRGVTGAGDSATDRTS